MITLRNVHKSFGAQKVLDGLDLDIPDGKITAVIGPSGEGKSVLLKHLIGLLQPDSGTVEVDGESILNLRRSELNRIRDKFGMLFQNVALFDSMTVFENVAFPLQEKTTLSKEDIRSRVLSALEDVGLKNIEHKYPDELSGGMKKRVGLARAVVLNPKIILFDEPTTGLDPIIKRAIHEIPEIFDVAQNVAMLFRGKILQHGTPDEIINSADPAIRQFISGSLDGPIQMMR
jgi:phospholipid/cholesterol/gamma-HCH transport system ATP-binding protein